MKIIYAPSGRSYYRTMDGTVMRWRCKGIYKETLILDAKYRMYGFWSDNCINTPGLVSSKEGYGYIKSDYINQFTNPIDSRQNNICAYATDEYLDGRMFFHDPNSSFYNTKKISEAYNKSAADVCLNVECALPSIDLLVRIYCDGNTIDSLDPTENCNTLKLSIDKNGWFSDLIPPFAWSSSEYDHYYPWCVLYSGLIGCVGKSDSIGGIIPVKDLV